MFYFQKAVKRTAACCRYHLFILPLYIPVLVSLTPAGLCVEHHLSRRLPLLLSEPTTCLALTVWGPVFSATGWALWGLLLLTTSALVWLWFPVCPVGSLVSHSNSGDKCRGVLFLLPLKPGVLSLSLLCKCGCSLTYMSRLFVCGHLRGTLLLLPSFGNILLI